jgi:hypothetical protein
VPVIAGVAFLDSVQLHKVNLEKNVLSEVSFISPCAHLFHSSPFEWLQPGYDIGCGFFRVQLQHIGTDSVNFFSGHSMYRW